MAQQDRTQGRTRRLSGLQCTTWYAASSMWHTTRHRACMGAVACTPPRALGTFSSAPTAPHSAPHACCRSTMASENSPDASEMLYASPRDSARTFAAFTLCTQVTEAATALASTPKPPPLAPLACACIAVNTGVAMPSGTSAIAALTSMRADTTLPLARAERRKLTNSGASPGHRGVLDAHSTWQRGRPSRQSCVSGGKLASRVVSKLAMPFSR